MWCKYDKQKTEGLLVRKEASEERIDIYKHLLPAHMYQPLIYCHTQVHKGETQIEITILKERSYVAYFDNHVQ